jgi:hypothetical protein
MQIHGAQCLYLSHQVNNQVYHDIEERWRKAYLQLWQCLRNEFLQRLQFIMVNYLLWDLVEEVAQSCDCHLYKHQFYSHDGNREESGQHDMTIMRVVVGEYKVFHWHKTPDVRVESRWNFQSLQPHTNHMFLFWVEVVACYREQVLLIWLRYRVKFLSDA